MNQKSKELYNRLIQNVSQGVAKSYVLPLVQAMDEENQFFNRNQKEVLFTEVRLKVINKVEDKALEFTDGDSYVSLGNLDEALNDTFKEMF